jgi:two-component system sensor histidine kinase YesM
MKCGAIMNTKNNIKGLLSRLTSISIVKKMIIGYFVIIFIPVLVFGYLLYNQFYKDILQEFARERQLLLEQAYNNWSVNLTQVESAYQLLQYNSNFINYLNGGYDSDSESVYFFLKDIRPIFSQIKLGYPFIKNFRVYKNIERVKGFSPEIIGIDELDQENVSVHSIPPGKGIWTIKNGKSTTVPEFNYYQRIYNQSYSRELGILEIIIKKELIEEFVSQLENQDEYVAFIINNSEILYENKNIDATITGINRFLQKTEKEDGNYVYNHNSNVIVNSLFIENLNLRIVKIGNVDEIFAEFKDKRNKLILYIVLLLFALSAIYYFLASSTSKKVLKLASHMRTVDQNNLKEYSESGEQDEIGFLTSSYNSMIKRIDDLINKVQREEIMRKEAEYLALQSQINPHFIYNTLETIRMLAETNNDTEVADISYTFGQLMRYSLSPKKNEATLREEVNHVQNYLNIHKFRMGERLEVQFHIEMGIENIECPRFILQPIIENSIVHGITKSRNLGKLTIEIKETHDFIKTIIQDNGVGIPEERLKLIKKMLNHSENIKDFQTSKGGLGLFNVQERIKLFFGEDSYLSIQSHEGQGTCCVLMLRKRRGRR